MAYRILLAEDEGSLREMISLNLDLEGYHTVSVSTGMQALRKAREERFDLLILDVMLPELDGFAVCESIRLENATVPILFLTAKNASTDRVQGLKLGADDYLAKPFDLEELLLRVNSLIKRGLDRIKTGSSIGPERSFGGNSINFNTFEITCYNGTHHTLSKKEIQLLKLLIDREGEVVSRKMILEKVWGYDIFPSTRTIDNFILVFRKLFEPNPREPVYFHSVRGVGYRFTSGA
ncbi:MAG: response regulator transcription factor [Bacteroidia bacterium]|jgi:two-component system alkaline phosphatase synthesis response regulator PhoP|nr:response regulator transcription factor [Bacteroidia bacterium]